MEAPLGPVDAGATVETAHVFIAGNDQSARAQQRFAVAVEAHGIAVEVERMRGAQAIEYRDTEPAREMLVAGARRGEIAVGDRPLLDPARCREHQRLDPVRDVFVGEPVITMPALTDDAEQTCL